MNVTLRPETRKRLAVKQAADRVARSEATKSNWLARIAEYRKRGWDDLADTEAALFAEHYAR